MLILTFFGTLGVSTHQTLPVPYMLYTYGGTSEWWEESHSRVTAAAAPA